MNSEAAWQWMGEQYAQPGRAAALLAAQDREGLDVVLALFADYCGLQGSALSAAELAQADALVRGWREEVVAPLRGLRRAMKEKPAPGAGGMEAAEAVRQQVQQAELAAERAELDALCEWHERLRAARGRP
jgi:uncharacterized protein (TIGR02444 family)